MGDVLLVLGACLGPLTLLAIVGGSLWWGRARWKSVWGLVSAGLCALVAGGLTLLMTGPAAMGLPLLFFLVIWPALTPGSPPVMFGPREPEPVWVGLGMLATAVVFLIWHLPLLLSVALVGLRGALLPRLWVMGTLLMGALWLSSAGAWFLRLYERDTSWLLLALVPYGLVLVALGGQLVFMSLPVRRV